MLLLGPRCANLHRGHCDAEDFHPSLTGFGFSMGENPIRAVEAAAGRWAVRILALANILELHQKQASRRKQFGKLLIAIPLIYFDWIVRYYFFASTSTLLLFLVSNLSFFSVLYPAVLVPCCTAYG